MIPAFLSLTDPDRLPARLLRPVAAIGNFDGVHRGHRFVFDEAITLARSLGRPAVALTFNPHPRQFFQPHLQHFQLTPPDVQAERIAAAGLDGLVVLSFNAALAGLGAEAFVSDLLVGRLAISGAVVGADFHYGKGRAGTPASFAAAGERLGFSVKLLPQREDNGEPVSSTRIRASLEDGDCETANRLLGYTWFVRGPVIHGEKRGRDLGYPTANMALAPGTRLRHGIYAVHITIDGAPHGGVASFGRRPTFDNGAPLLETHVFDFKGDLYGKAIDVAFVRYLRPEAKFDSLDALVRQMDADSAEARAILAAAKN
ncbi:MAG: bifunctional riboflavin kinase/FAD synthetase [Proteobacteria bacterium]|nr:bifunctional riboflavin kinase/FAD synthetase [Pseudomonadota bacterium]